MTSALDLTHSDGVFEVEELVSEGSSDSDFLSQPVIVVATPSKRKLLDMNPGQFNDSYKLAKNDGPLIETCGICSDAWTSTGTHQISSIVCGHLFGKSCLEKLLQEKATVSRHLTQAACPICKYPFSYELRLSGLSTLFRKKEIHPIWSKRTKNLDPSELEETSKFMREINLEIDSMTNELETLKVQHQNSELELELCRKELTEVKRKIAGFENPELEGFETVDPTLMSAGANQMRKTFSFKKPTIKKPIFDFKKSIEIGTLENFTQVFAYDFEEQIVLASKKITNESYGIVTFNLRNINFQRVYPVHSGPIRDIVIFKYNEETRALSVGMDRTLVLSNPRSLTVLATYLLPTPGWSCCYNITKPSILYVGSISGQVLEFDTSKTNCSSHSRIYSYPSITMRSPVHSLYYLEKYNALLGANLDGVYIWAFDSEFIQDPVCYKVSDDAFTDLQCYSLAYDPYANNFAVSFRNSKTKATHHQVCSFHYTHIPSVAEEQSKRLKAMIKFAIDSPFAENSLPKTALFSPVNPNLNLFSESQHTFLCIREEAEQETLIWDLTVSTTHPYRLKLNSDLESGCPIAYIFCQESKSHSQAYLLVLTNTRVLIFQYNAP